MCVRLCRSQATALLDPVALQTVASKHYEVRQVLDKMGPCKLGPAL